MTPRFVVIQSRTINGIDVPGNPFETRTLKRAEYTWDALSKHFREAPDGDWTMKIYDRLTGQYVRVARMVATMPVRPYDPCTAPNLDQYRPTPEARAAAIADLKQRRII
jgi:hypothetical protein